MNPWRRGWLSFVLARNASLHDAGREEIDVRTCRHHVGARPQRYLPASLAAVAAVAKILLGVGRVTDACCRWDGLWLGCCVAREFSFASGIGRGNAVMLSNVI